MLIWIMLIGSVFNMNASTFNVDGDVVIIHTDKPKSSTTTSNSKPRHAPMHRKTKMVRLEFLQDMNDVIILLKESGQITETYNIGNIQDKKLKNPSLVSHYLYDTSIYNTQKCKDCSLFPVCDGGCQWFKHKNIFEGKQYNICSFLNNQHILEECLLSDIEKHAGTLHKVLAI